MREATNGVWWIAARWAPRAAIVILATACDSPLPPPTRPSPSQTPVPVPAPAPAPAPAPFVRTLNTVFLAAPAAPPRSSGNSLAGRYQLEVDAGERSGTQCESVPAYATRRQYTADIDDLGDHYAVKLYDAAFLADSAGVGYGCRDSRLPQSGLAACHQFLLTGNADALTVTARAEDDWRGSEIWEALPDGFLLAITGRATGRVREGRIEATGTGSIWYGNGLPASTFYGCQSAALRYTLSPR